MKEIKETKQVTACCGSGWTFLLKESHGKKENGDYKLIRTPSLTCDKCQKECKLKEVELMKKI